MITGTLLLLFTGCGLRSASGAPWVIAPLPGAHVGMSECEPREYYPEKPFCRRVAGSDTVDYVVDLTGVVVWVSLASWSRDQGDRVARDLRAIERTLAARTNGQLGNHRPAVIDGNCVVGGFGHVVIPDEHSAPFDPWSFTLRLAPLSACANDTGEQRSGSPA